MKRALLVLMLATLSQWGCSPQFWGGTAVGVLAAGAGYEINAKRQIDQLEEDYRNERIGRREYESRRQQIERGSLIY